VPAGEWPLLDEQEVPLLSVLLSSLARVLAIATGSKEVVDLVWVERTKKILFGRRKSSKSHDTEEIFYILFEVSCQL
jgi:hypothetical protein